MTKLKGFSFLETILYVAILSAFIGGAIVFAWDVIYGQVRSTAQQEVIHNLRFASEKIGFEVRNAVDISSVSNSNITIVTSDPLRNPTVFDLSNGQIRMGYGIGGDCPSSNPCPITSSLVEITALTFLDLADAEGLSRVISYTITGSHVNPANRHELNYTETYVSSSEVRSQ